MTDLLAEGVDPELARQRRATDHSLWARLNVWFARHALIVFVISLVTMGAGFLGYTPGKSPGARFALLDKKMDSTADTLSKRVAETNARVDARLHSIEEDHQVLRSYVRFLVVTRCLELSPRDQRDLIVADINCRQLQTESNQP